MANERSLLSSSQVEQMLTGDLRDLARPAAVKDLLERVAASLRASEETNRRLHADVTRIASRSKTQGTPMASALSALSELDADEQRQVLDVWGIGLLEKVNDAQAEARERTLVAMSALARTKLALAAVVEHEDTPQNVRDKAQRMLEQLPTLSILEPVEVDFDNRETTGFTVEPKTDAEEIRELIEPEEPQTEYEALAPLETSSEEATPVDLDVLANLFDDYFAEEPVNLPADLDEETTYEELPEEDNNRAEDAFDTSTEQASTEDRLEADRVARNSKREPASNLEEGQWAYNIKDLFPKKQD